MGDESSLESVSENAFATIDSEQLDSQCSVDRTVKGTKMSVSSITKKIRTKLPNVGYYLKRLMRVTSGEKLGSERVMIDDPLEINEITEISINEKIIPGNRDTLELSGNHVAQTRWYDSRSDPSCYFTGLDSEEASSSSNMNSTSEYQSTTTVSQIEYVQTIPNSMNTVEAMTNGIFVNVLNSDLPAGNILEFREALSSQFGLQAGRLRNQEPRSVPLVYAQNDDRHELYLQGSVNGESGFSGSSTIGSEISSISENDYSDVRNQRIGQDSAEQFFGGVLNLDTLIRKPICRKDDEPTIY
ncbi:uncharacterized protein LOC113464432 [Ceratina calcarata]|uniref:Uncharacterized protein LOC113464432 n=1 Tax=Ceratina calcarata TaxID=156304 RepID=A0AAJ7S3A2_9HYME|nr:uncharacterized protein LOC113464432 [Ceratina calcarata]